MASGLNPALTYSVLIQAVGGDETINNSGTLTISALGTGMGRRKVDLLTVATGTCQ